MSNDFTKTFISILVFIAIIVIAAKYCNFAGRRLSEQQIDAMIKESESKYKDSIEFIRGQQDLKEEQLIAANNKILALNDKIDSITKKHATTKTKIKPAPIGDLIIDTGFVLAPNEYVTECEDCFVTLNTYKKESDQLRFERDAYDSLLRQENRIHENRINEIANERDQFKKAFIECEFKYGTSTVTRKLKISAMGMLNDLFLPNGGGGGLIYEDKKFNEYGAHVLLTGRGNIYLLHVAKTISFKRKK